VGISISWRISTLQDSGGNAVTKVLYATIWLLGYVIKIPIISQRVKNTNKGTEYKLHSNVSFDLRISYEPAYTVSAAFAENFV
jgi:hypothetical protein